MHFLNMDNHYALMFGIFALEVVSACFLAFLTPKGFLFMQTAPVNLKKKTNTYYALMTLFGFVSSYMLTSSKVPDMVTLTCTTLASICAFLWVKALQQPR
jgi:hypothetical protein